MERASELVPVLLASLRDANSVVATQSIVSGTNLFCGVSEEMALQFRQRGKVEPWVEELWTWMVKLKDTVFSIALEPGSIGPKVVALKFMETFVLLFTSDNESESSFKEGSRRMFNISWLVGGHPTLDPVKLMSEANRVLSILLDLLRSSSNLPGALAITVINCLASIARKRPVHYTTVLSALLNFRPNVDSVRGCHGASIQYSVRTSFLGFLRCTHPAIAESREKLLRALKSMNAGDAADQVIRQVDKKIRNNERALRENRFGRDDQLSRQLHVSADMLKKRSVPQDSEELTNGVEVAPKRTRYSLDAQVASAVQKSDSGHDSVSENGVPPSVPQLNGELTPVEQMIAMIGALLAEGERGAESLEILISNIHPDLLADIVITNMKHLPKSSQTLPRFGSLPPTQPVGSLSNAGQVAPPLPTISLQSPVPVEQLSSPSSTAISSSFSDMPAANSLATDSKRDPRRDPRRLDPRRAVTLTEVASVPVMEDTEAMPSEFDVSISQNPIKTLSVPVVSVYENSAPNPESDDRILVSPSVSGNSPPDVKEEVLNCHEETVSLLEVNGSSDCPLTINADGFPERRLSNEMDGADSSSLLESDQQFSALSNATESEETCKELPLLPSYIELDEEQQKSVQKLAVERIIESNKHLNEKDCSQMRMSLLARLVSQIDADDEIVMMLHENILVDYRQQKGHELVLHILYHLHSLMISGSAENSSAAVAYDKFLLAVAKLLLDTLPASDKSFSRLLGEVPILPNSALTLLDNLCYSDVHDSNGKELRDGERVTQGLGAVWSLILGRPTNRQACLGIALKCAVHSQDDVRAKAIRLVANKLYQLNYVSENIEKFATDMFLSAVNHQVSDMEVSQSQSIEQRPEGEVGNQETSTSGSKVSETGVLESDSIMVAQSAKSSAISPLTVSFPEAQRLISLFFALCTKKPSLLQLLFNIYGRAPKTVKQAFHRHVPILLRALGSSCSELLRIISDPPPGSENLLTLVLQILTQETTPSSKLVATVKHLYETKLKDVAILIPMLSSLSKNEVLPIFPRLVNLPLEKFQMALAHILQGSAHTGPALTPAEVLVAIHGIAPEKDSLPLKKITDACSACFEQRTVFTQQVLAKALHQMVSQTPLPLLFMRTIIQAIDAFPTMVDFVMEILSKLISKQVWRLPKLWVGFLKCVSQTQPHSFPVLLQLPPPQLESALNKYASLRSPLAAYVSQPSIQSSIPRSTLAVLGIANESSMQQTHIPSLHPSDPSSSIQGTNLT